MNITLITSESIKDFPPVITLLQTLSKFDHNLCVITPYKDSFLKELNVKNLKTHYVIDACPSFMTRYYTNRIKASFSFRSEQLLRKILLRRIPERFEKIIQKSDLVWILHENTIILGGKSFLSKLESFIFTMYELQIKNGKTSELYNMALKRAKLTVVPEYCRAHIAKAYYNLSEIPEILPNKPLEHPRIRNLSISDTVIAEKIKELKATGKKLIMYMGILSSERPLEPLIEAASTSKDYVLTVLGARTPYLDRLQKEMGERFIYLGAVKPPYHLEIASHADIAYISYVPNNGSINAVFCAPNKVYEFAGFGIPMLCNDNPGLKYTVEYYSMGVCVPILNTESILSALEQIDSNYDKMSHAALRYYDKESVEEAVQRILKRYQILTKDNKR